uniref:Uncharacterized protein n=1 Tax=Taenia asiatica TaxID=60517 RepID=A0A0R3VVB2_TAEAS
MSASYPEGNFGGNQLPDGLISLLSLCSRLTIDLHNLHGPPLKFPLASTCASIVHHLSGLNKYVHAPPR